MSTLDVAERARRLLEEKPSRIVIEEPTPQAEPTLDPILFLLILPFLPLYLLYMAFLTTAQPRRRITITEIERTPTGYRILEIER